MLAEWHKDQKKGQRRALLGGQPGQGKALRPWGGRESRWRRESGGWTKHPLPQQRCQAWLTHGCGAGGSKGDQPNSSVLSGLAFHRRRNVHPSELVQDPREKRCAARPEPLCVLTHATQEAGTHLLLRAALAFPSMLTAQTRGSAHHPRVSQWPFRQIPSSDLR